MYNLTILRVQYSFITALSKRRADEIKLYYTLRRTQSDIVFVSVYVVYCVYNL